MSEFFKFMIGFANGWRRRLGLRVLVLALVFMVGWIRSLAFYDEIRFHTAPDTTDGLISTDSSIGWERRTGFESHAGQSSSFMEFSVGHPFVDISSSSDPRQSRWDWKWYWCGFGDGSAVYGSGLAETGFEHHTFWVVPYWSLVFPLTLLSACLLLLKPRPLKQTTTVDPIPEKTA